MEYFVYRYLDKDGNIIYVGLTSRPLKQRVKEHSIEKLNFETAKIQYITVPNESQMHQREWYYIDAYKPKYNKRDVHRGKPEIMPEYDGKWIEYPVNGDIKQIEWIINMINSKIFCEGERLNYFVTLANKRNIVGNCSDRILNDNGQILREIRISEADFYDNSKRMLIDILSQMIQYVIEFKYGIKASNNGRYFNRNVNKYFELYGIKTQKTKYGYKPINCSDFIVSIFSQYEYGNKNISLYTKNGTKNTSTIKYIDEYGQSVRATKKHILLCLDYCSEEMIKQAIDMLNVKPMVLK